MNDQEHDLVDPTFATWFHQNRALHIGAQTLESLLTTMISHTDPTVFDSLPPPTLRPQRISTYPPSTSADAESDDADTFLSRFQDTVRKKSRRLMVTIEGYVGMAPCRARLGDSVVVLFGCSIPLILRRVGVREAWQVIGEAYVHGFMNGEARRLVRKGTRMYVDSGLFE
ncbi:hypothetical protein BU26DRAFT_446762 [Trematosphaeria pertusa]|uniref:Uncharacterized protein n=1 Tax=Trematosphaeria pertusa TaxID=390896 RepID=A0A6A6J3T0_9PLEO|nr:uncharacterized protein BU26DRAFT_446762 [Trematosphaeria pertusa]KAF2257359.1 hypothetical protein BU26DRAFT_446762 [Trematosphaeria pertusa]